MKLDLAQLEFIEPKLRGMTLDVEATFDVEFTITSLYRIGDNGVHGQLPLRGLDLRCRNDDLGNDIAFYVNSKWIYDPARTEMKCCMYHAVEGGAPHIHLQVHPNTRKR